jgi:hypothetical protein
MVSHDSLRCRLDDAAPLENPLIPLQLLLYADEQKEIRAGADSAIGQLPKLYREKPEMSFVQTLIVTGGLMNDASIKEVVIEDAGSARPRL